MGSVLSGCSSVCISAWLMHLHLDIFSTGGGSMSLKDNRTEGKVLLGQVNIFSEKGAEICGMFFFYAAWQIIFCMNIFCWLWRLCPFFICTGIFFWQNNSLLYFRGFCGCCCIFSPQTGFHQPWEVEKRVRALSDQGWKFESMEPVKGRCCLCFSRDRMIVVFTKE